jgi:hypothetical protein
MRRSNPANNPSTIAPVARVSANRQGGRPENLLAESKALTYFLARVKVLDFPIPSAGSLLMLDVLEQSQRTRQEENFSFEVWH